MTSNLAYLRRSNAENNQLTREAIETALLLLLDQKPLKQIAITELVERAGVTRNSFYRNYASKEAVLVSVLRGKFDELAQTNHALFQQDKETGLLAILTFIDKDRSFYQKLLTEGLRQLLEESIYSYQPGAYHEISREKCYRNRFISAGFTRIIWEWLTTSNPESPEALTQLVLAIWQ